jgi:hypothetical protein
VVVHEAQACNFIFVSTHIFIMNSVSFVLSFNAIRGQMLVRELSIDNFLHVIKNSNVLSSEHKDSISCDKPFVILIYICNLYVIFCNSFIYIYKALTKIDGKVV